MGNSFDGIKQRRFGVEIEMTGLTRCQAAIAVAGKFGSEPVHLGGSYDKYYAVDNKDRKWFFVYDGSIKCYDSNGCTADSTYSVELNTPVLEYEDIPLLQEVIRILRSAGAKSSPEYKCGTHYAKFLVTRKFYQINAIKASI